MKKIILASTVLAFTLFGCQDVNDKFDWLDGAVHPSTPSSYSFTISDADIATIVTKTKNTDDQAQGETLSKDKIFSDNASPETLIPYLLPTLYYSPDLGSTATVTYQFKTNRDAELTGLSTSSSNPIYVLGSADYKAVWGDPFATALTPTKSPATELPKLLASNFPNAEDGSYKLIEYAYSTEEPVSSIVIGNNIFKQDFEGLGLVANDPVAVSGWLNVDLEGSRTWQMKVYDNNLYAQASSNGSKEVNDNWLITAPIDLKNASNPYLTFDIKVGYYNTSCLDILVSSNFDGNEANIKSATWSNITSQFAIPTTPTNGYSPNFVSVGLGSLTSYKGKTVYIAFRYKGDDTSTPKATTTYQIDNIQVTEAVTGKEVKVKGNQYVAYQFASGSWKPVSSDVIVLQPADYTFVGANNGYMNASQASVNLSAILVRSNLPQIEGSEKVVVYKNTANSFYAERLTYTSGVWKINSLIETRTGQFVKSSKGWVFDPTFISTMTTEDYQLVVNYVIQHQAVTESGLVNKNKNAEYYYGFNAYYKNITFRASDRSNDPSYPVNGTDAEKLKFCQERAIEGFEVLLTLKYPDATPQVNGIDQLAKISAIIYDGSVSDTFTYEFQCVGNKEWKYIQRTSTSTGVVEKAE